MRRRASADVAVLLCGGYGRGDGSVVTRDGRDGRPLPWSSPGRLDALIDAWRARHDRTSRLSGGLRSYRPRAAHCEPYRALCHGLRPLRIVWGCPLKTLTESARSLLSSTGCTLWEVAIPVRERRLFDGADPNSSTPERQATTVPTQALFFMNDPLVHESAKALATRVADKPTAQAQIDALFMIALQRPSSPREFESLMALAPPGSTRLSTEELASVARVVVSGNSFLTVD